MTDLSISGAMSLSVDAQGNFTIDHEPEGNRFRFSTATHEASIRSFGTYVLTVTTSFTLGDPAITFTDGQPADVEISDLGTNSFTLKIFVSRESKNFPQTVGFEIHSSDPDVNSIVDPTILIEPPDFEDEKLTGGEQGTLVIGVTLDADDQFVYEELLVDTPNLQWIEETQSVRVSNLATGRYFVVYSADFELGVPAIKFPNGRPAYITLQQTRYLAVLEVRVQKGQPNEVVLLQLKAASGGIGIKNEPTILVEPPDLQS